MNSKVKLIIHEKKEQLFSFVLVVAPISTLEFDCIIY